MRVSEEEEAIIEQLSMMLGGVSKSQAVKFAVLSLHILIKSKSYKKLPPLPILAKRVIREASRGAKT